MKKFSSLLMLLLALVMSTGMAKAADFNIGYTYGDAEGSSILESEGENVSNSVAVYITPEYAKTLKGDLLNGVNFYLYSRSNISFVTVWVRSDLKGSNLAYANQSTISNLKAKAWNQMKFDKPYTIGEEGFYIGVSWTQKKKARVATYQNYDIPNAAWCQLNNGEWNNTEVSGAFCVEGMVSGDAQLKNDVALLKVSLDKYFLIANKVYNINTLVHNAGSSNITSLDYEMDIEGLGAVKATAKTNVKANSSAEVPVVFELPIKNAGTPVYKVNSVKITAVNGAPDEFDGNNAIKNPGEILVAERGFKKRVLIEEFTTEKCPNCPPVANLLHQILTLDEYKDNVDAICHHSGYYTDKFTLPADNAYCWFYNDGGATYAPAFMIDRLPMEGEPGPVFFPSPTSLVLNTLDQQLAEVAFARVLVDFEPIPETENKLEVTVTAERATEILNETGIVTIYLVEDNIPTTGQAGASGNYMQQHVTRALNATWGVPVVWENNKFVTNYTFTLKPEWVRKNMRVTAMISNYNKSNPNDCQIYNVTYRTLDGYSPTGGDSGVQDITTGVQAPEVVGIYDTMGNRHNDYVKGINIVVMSDGTSRKVMK